MKKHLFSSLGLALLLMAWGGANTTAEAAVTYTKVASVDFENDTENQIPKGWTVVNNGVTRLGGTDYNSWSDAPTYNGNPYAGGSRLFNFPNSIQSFKKALYLGVNYSANETLLKETYALYGDQEDYKFSLPAGTFEVRVPAIRWVTNGSSNIVVQIAKSTDASFESPVLNELTGLSYCITNQYNDDLSEVQILKFYITIEDAGDYLVKIAPEKVSQSALVFGGISAYSYEGTSSKYDDDESMVFEETFADITSEYTPSAESGWNIYVNGTKKAPGVLSNYSNGGGARIRNMSNATGLSKIFYGTGNSYLIYGEGNELTLESGEYFISYYAAGWNGIRTQTMEILDSNNDEIVQNSVKLTVNSNEGKNVISPNHIQFVAQITTKGNYKLKFYGDGGSNDGTVIGNITIRKNTNLAIIAEDFADLNNASPKEGSGWTMYEDQGKSYAKVDNGTTGMSGRARIMSNTGYANLANSFYTRFNGSITYGEVSGQPLTLVGGKEYRLSYYAARQDVESRSLTCSIYGADAELNLGSALSRVDYLAGKVSTNTADYIETIFIPAKSGDYILKFTGYQAHVGNITLAENYENPIVYTATLDANVGYSTLYVDRAVAIPSGVKAYVAALNEDNTKVTLNELSDNIPANTAVIIEGTPGATVTFKPATAPADAVESKALDGVLVGTTLPTDKDYYTLAYTLDDNGQAQNLGFYKSAAKALRANKAYIALTASSSISALRIQFGDEEPGNVTAIEQVKAETSAARVIFDLSGRRVANMDKPGLYILNGKKVLVK